MSSRCLESRRFDPFPIDFTRRILPGPYNGSARWPSPPFTDEAAQGLRRSDLLQVTELIGSALATHEGRATRSPAPRVTACGAARLTRPRPPMVRNRELFPGLPGQNFSL